jgi:hypothetical protein
MSAKMYLGYSAMIKKSNVIVGPGYLAEIMICPFC